MGLLNSLQEITTVYTFFERDQVLTDSQLNSISAYLDDQSRLTRVNLLGVGLACGLRPSLQGGAVVIAPGVGVTTDGDLLFLTRETIFDKFKPYDDTNPQYPPFSQTGNLIPLYELVRQGDADDRARDLSTFADTEKSLDNMAALLLMESYRKKKDNCSGTQCDNLGQDCLNTVKVLLGDRTTVKSLLDAQISPPLLKSPQAIVINRPLLPGGLTTIGQLGKIYLGACQVLYPVVVKALKALSQDNAVLLADVFPEQKEHIIAEWLKLLEILNAKFIENTLGLQYYFDFLKDLAETYNHFCELIYNEQTWCCPNFEAFPKHLLLGNLVPGAAPDDNRTPFYPSPLLSRTAGQINHAGFLLQKLNALLHTFHLPETRDSRITPSHFEDRPLEERAIPCYYRLLEEYPIQRYWNFRLSQRGLESHNYSYHARDYRAQGGAANPLAAQIGPFSFFRIEGHLGQNISAVADFLEKQILELNLPFNVGAVLLAADRTKIVKKPGIRYTDLHRFHYLLRQDISQQLDDVANFAGNLHQEVNANLDIQVEAEANDYRNKARTHKDAILAQAGKARDKLNTDYSTYKQFIGDNSWLPDVRQTMQVAGDLKLNLGPVTKTEFPSPVDAFIVSPHLRWLDLLDNIIVQKDQQEDTKLLFANFLSRHPGLAHYGGVLRGGTFILVYDTDKKVVADFMVPYHVEDITTPEAEQPPLPKPNLIPDLILNKGVTIVPSRQKFVAGRLATFKGDLQPQIDNQQKSFQIFKDSVDAMSRVYTSFGSVKGKAETGPVFQDPKLSDYTRSLNDKQIVLKFLQAQIKPDTPADQKALLQKQIDGIEMETAGIVNEATNYLNTSGADVSLGSEGQAILMEVNKSTSLLQGSRTIAAVNNNLDKVARETTNSNLKVTLSSIMIRRQ